MFAVYSFCKHFNQDRNEQALVFVCTIIAYCEQQSGTDWKKLFGPVQIGKTGPLVLEYNVHTFMYIYIYIINGFIR